MTYLKNLAVGTDFQLYSRYRNGTRRPRMTYKTVTEPAVTTVLNSATCYTFGRDVDGKRFKHAIGRTMISIERKAKSAQAILLGTTLTVVEQHPGYTLVSDVNGVRTPLFNELTIRPR